MLGQVSDPTLHSLTLARLHSERLIHEQAQLDAHHHSAAVTLHNVSTLPSVGLGVKGDVASPQRAGLREIGTSGIVSRTLGTRQHGAHGRKREEVEPLMASLILLASSGHSTARLSRAGATRHFTARTSSAGATNQ